MMPTLRIRLTKPSGAVIYVFSRGLQWMALNEHGEQAALSQVTHDPVMLMFALEDALLQAEHGPALALAAAKTYCPDDFTCNLVPTARKPHRPKPALDLSLEAAGLGSNK